MKFQSIDWEMREYGDEGDLLKGTYIGETFNNRPHGFGTFTHKEADKTDNKIIFMGRFSNGERDGIVIDFCYSEFYKKKKLLGYGKVQEWKLGK